MYNKLNSFNTPFGMCDYLKRINKTGDKMITTRGKKEKLSYETDPTKPSG